MNNRKNLSRDQSNSWSNNRNNQSSKLAILRGKTSKIERFNLYWFFYSHSFYIKKIFRFNYNNSDRIEENHQWIQPNKRQSSKSCISIEVKPLKTKGLTFYFGCNKLFNYADTK